MTLPTRGDFYMFINRGAHFTADPNQVSPYTRCSTFYPDGANLSAYCRPELDALWDQGLTSTDPEVRAPIYHEAFQMINADPRRGHPVLARDDDHAQLVADRGGIRSASAEFFTWNIAEWGWTA